MAAPAQREPRPDGVARHSSLIVAATGHVALTIGYVIANRSTPQPGATDTQVLHYAQSHGGTMTLGALLLIASAVALVLLAAAMHQRLRALGATTYSRALTLTGGLMAAGALTGSALYIWRGAGAATTDEAVAFAEWSFIFGGPAFAATLAVLILGTSTASVRLPRAINVTGLLLAAAGLVSILSPAITPLSYLLPIVRFGGLIWLGFAATQLARSRTSSKV
ncbi:hypothetical protein [Nonomuraea sp. 10N515B]|uniref:hypothetical protein n=1 Tax=Nonomuraea sp. 10N515B TaxID=3457422 RepID=UPI003FCEB200